ncbi:GAF domain-containing protein [Filimonas effusa]|uniref:GAF domain-containing protein n=1 Tax=Filimonas effusa TaxID=2508721 RepID=A0A4Q1D5E1_9BACT|nr:GAF domain-containing protein [Filimonas effusa]RXK83752.1 GAF domain-containing protein [Filimonas effusa]
MNINTNNYDSTFCGSLPIHHINVIQPYGVLLVLEQESLNIVQASENVPQIFEITAQELVQHSLAEYLDERSAATLKSKFEKKIRDKIPVLLTINGVKVLSIIHARERYLLLELELATMGQTSETPFVDVYQDIKYAMAAIDLAETTREICRIAAQELKKISGFDKVMVYQFDAQWNGNVVAEEMEEGMESYMGFTFPASDIPKQARALYLKNPYRFIPDRLYKPEKLYPVINPLTHSFVDLSDCNVRGVAAVHLEYLKNMGVIASMSTRIIHNDTLWGLIACHHRTAKPMSYQECAVFELLSNVLSTKIASLLHKEQLAFDTSINSKRLNFIEAIYNNSKLADAFVANGSNILSLFRAGGAAFIQDERIVSVGEVPARDELADLAMWLSAKKQQEVFHENNLAAVNEHAASYANIGSGLLVIPLGESEDAYLAVFRPEVIHTVNWGGNPNEAIRFEGDNKTYHPRFSFSLWQQTVRQTSLPWREEEIKAAENIRSFIYEYSTRKK